jgi:CheY-like chemotaxis protein
MRPSVIVVDDDGAFRRLASRLLADMGLDVVAEVGTIAEALAATDALRPHAALVDVSLADGDGLTLARRLTALPSPPRVVLTSSDREAVSPAVARAAGAVGFVGKTELLDGSLRRWLVGDEPE